MRFRFLALDKRIALTARDRVGNDLRLLGFDYDYLLDGNRLILSGQVQDNELAVAVVGAHQRQSQRLPLDGPLYPASVIQLYPVLHGLEVGRRYEYRVFSGETQSVAEVQQDILGYERSDLFQGAAFKVKTRMLGQEVTTWIAASGKPVLEMSLGGVVISGLESEPSARRYLTSGVVNKTEVLLDFSLIQTSPPIENPRQVKELVLLLVGVPQEFELPSDGLQSCRRASLAEYRCRITSAVGEEGVAHQLPHLTEVTYLRSSLAVPSEHSLIQRKATDIAGDYQTRRQQITAVVTWLQENIEQRPVDSFSALEVLDSRQAECQGHSYLYAAFARALGIPTRVVNGIVYSDHFRGFLYHTWAESLVDGLWLPVDPTFGQIPVDATHIKLVEGERLEALTPLVGLVGRLKARVVAVVYR